MAIVYYTNWTSIESYRVTACYRGASLLMTRAAVLKLGDTTPPMGGRRKVVGTSGKPFINGLE